MKKLLLAGIITLLAASLSARAAEAKDNYEQSCQKCHGADGKGATKMGQRLGCKDYTDPKVQAALKDDEAIKAIKEGFKDADGKTIMKGYDALSDDEVKALVAYMRTFKP